MIFPLKIGAEMKYKIVYKLLLVQFKQERVYKLVVLYFRTDKSSLSFYAKRLAILRLSRLER
jgi:hypothetical protein